MSTMSLRDINKVYPNGVQAVFDFNLEVADGEFIVLVGPSGCGKSTTLRMIAGLEEISSGEFLINDDIMNDKAPKDRDIAMVFQNYALYAHMTVYHNMAFSLTLRRVGQDIIHERVMWAADILGLKPYLNRKPAELSGGQRQRVAVGRAIVRDPKVFLFDEPLSNLDAKLRGTMRKELKLLHERLGATMIYVTHDQIEALTLASRIVIMNNGYVQQIGTPKEIYDNPKNLFVASFIGTPPMNIFDAHITEDGELVICDDIKINIKASPDFGILKKEKHFGTKVTIGIRPERVIASKAIASNTFPSTVEIYELLGADALVYFNVGDNVVIGKIPTRESMAMGDKIFYSFDVRYIYFFDSTTGNRITERMEE